MIRSLGTTCVAEDDFRIDIPVLHKVLKELESLRLDLTLREERTSELPKKQWYNLKEACEAKGVCYNTVKSIERYKPNGGVPDAIIHGRKYWSLETIQQWIYMTDKDWKK